MDEPGHPPQRPGADSAARAVITQLTERGPSTVGELAVRTGLTSRTVVRVVQRLRQGGVVIEPPAGSNRGTGGGRSTDAVVALATAPEYTMAIVIYHHDVVAALVDHTHTVVRQTRRTDLRWTDVDDIVRVCRALFMELAGAESYTVTTAVLGFPLAWDQQHGHVPMQRDRVHTRGVWVTWDLPRILENELGIPVLVENRCKLSALAEHCFGAAHGHDDVVYVQLVGGSNTASIVAGALVRGSAGYAGELSHLHVPGNSDPCRCGAAGCLGVTVPSADVLLERHRPHLAERVDRYDVLGLAAQGDDDLRTALHRLGTAYGEVLAVACLVLNPSVLVVDGLLGLAAGPVISGMTTALRSRLPDRVFDGMTVKVGALGVEAPLLGASALATSRPRTAARGA